MQHWLNEVNWPLVTISFVYNTTTAAREEQQQQQSVEMSVKVYENTGYCMKDVYQ